MHKIIIISNGKTEYLDFKSSQDVQSAWKSLKMNIIQTGNVNSNNAIFTIIDTEYKQEMTESEIILNDVLTPRTVNCLATENIHTVSQLVKWSEKQLLQTPNLGRKSLNEIKDYLSKIGLELK